MENKTISDISNPWPGAAIRYKETTLSTMEDARIAIDKHNANGTVLCAGFQEKGRGRFGEREWNSEKEKNLLFSLILAKADIPVHLSALPVFIGYNVGLSIEEMFGIPTLIKWPNDVLAEGKKLSGILCESYQDFVIVGIGINCNQENFPVHVQNSAASITMLTRRIVLLPDLLEAILNHLHSLDTLDCWKGETEKRLAYRGEQVTIVRGYPHTDNYALEKAIVTGMGDDGSLIVRDPRTGETRTIVSGEISIRT